MVTTGDFDVRVETTPSGAVVLHVLGELDLATAPRLEAAIADAVASSSISRAARSSTRPGCVCSRVPAASQLHAESP
jgi:hypothetical protein